MGYLGLRAAGRWAALTAVATALTLAVVERQMQEESQAPGEGGGSLKSHEEVERQYLPPYLLQILEEQWIASLAPWVSLQIKWLKPLPGSVY